MCSWVKLNLWTTLKLCFKLTGGENSQAATQIFQLPPSMHVFMTSFITPTVAAYLKSPDGCLTLASLHTCSYFCVYSIHPTARPSSWITKHWAAFPHNDSQSPSNTCAFFLFWLRSLVAKSLFFFCFSTDSLVFKCTQLCFRGENAWRRMPRIYDGTCPPPIPPPFFFGRTGACTCSRWHVTRSFTVQLNYSRWIKSVRTTV